MDSRKSKRDGLQGDVEFGDGGTDKKTEGQAEDAEIFVESDQNGQD